MTMQAVRRTASQKCQSKGTRRASSGVTWGPGSAGDAAKRRGSLAAGHDAAELAVLFLFTDGVALVVLLFAAGDADLDFDAAVLEVHGEGDEGGALDRGGLF